MPRARKKAGNTENDDDSENTVTRESHQREEPRQSRISSVFSAIRSAYSSRFDAALERRRRRKQSTERRRDERARAQRGSSSTQPPIVSAAASTTPTRPVLRRPLESQLGSRVTGISNASTSVTRRDYEFTDEEISCFPPSMAHCYKDWLNMEQLIRVYSGIGEFKSFLDFFTKCIAIPFRSQSRLFPWWAYPYADEIRSVLETAERLNIGTILPNIYEDLVNWAYNTQQKLESYGNDTDGCRHELRILWAVRAGTNQRRRFFAQRAQEDQDDYENGRLDHDRYHSRIQSFRQQKELIGRKLGRLDEAIAILKYIRHQRHQDPDNLTGDGPNVSSIDYESMGTEEREVLGYISEDIWSQEFQETYQATGLQREGMCSIEESSALVLARLVDYQCKFRPENGRQVTEAELADVDNHFAG